MVTQVSLLKIGNTTELSLKRQVDDLCALRGCRRSRNTDACPQQSHVCVCVFVYTVCTYIHTHTQ